MTSHCLCLREERTVMFRREWYCKQDETCPIFRIENFFFYLMDSDNFLAQLKLFSHTTKIFFFTLQLNFFHTQLKVDDYLRKKLVNRS